MSQLCKDNTSKMPCAHICGAAKAHVGGLEREIRCDLRSMAFILRFTKGGCVRVSTFTKTLNRSNKLTKQSLLFAT